MSVIIEVSLPAEEFKLGRILDMEEDTTVVLETMVPLGERSVPFFRVTRGRAGFETSVREHPAVRAVTVVNTTNDETLYALDWMVSEDSFFSGVRTLEASLLGASGTRERWTFELRFPARNNLSTFREYCQDADLPIDVTRIYNPTDPGAGAWYGMTAIQRRTLARAVEAGYYALPRQTTTQELADEFGISDQAVTERLRRAIDTIVTNTLLLEDEVELTADAES